MPRSKQTQDEPQDDAVQQQEPAAEQEQDKELKLFEVEQQGQDAEYAEKLQADAVAEHEKTKGDNPDPMLESVNYEKNKGAEADDA